MLVISGRTCPREKLSVCVSFLSPNKICYGNFLNFSLNFSLSAKGKVKGFPLARNSLIKISAAICSDFGSTGINCHSTYSSKIFVVRTTVKLRPFFMVRVLSSRGVFFGASNEYSNLQCPSILLASIQQVDYI